MIDDWNLDWEWGLKRLMNMGVLGDMLEVFVDERHVFFMIRDEMVWYLLLCIVF